MPRLPLLGNYPSATTTKTAFYDATLHFSCPVPFTIPLLHITVHDTLFPCFLCRTAPAFSVPIPSLRFLHFCISASGICITPPSSKQPGNNASYLIFACTQCPPILYQAISSQQRNLGPVTCCMLFARNLCAFFFLLW